jgi:hypothetical protein
MYEICNALVPVAVNWRLMCLRMHFQAMIKYHQHHIAISSVILIKIGGYYLVRHQATHHCIPSTSSRPQSKITPCVVCGVWCWRQLFHTIPKASDRLSIPDCLIWKVLIRLRPEEGEVSCFYLFSAAQSQITRKLTTINKYSLHQMNNRLSSPASSHHRHASKNAL